MKHKSITWLAIVIAITCSIQIARAYTNVNMNQDPTTLIVTSTPNPEEMEALKSYVQDVMPLLLDLGGTVIKRSKITEAYHGEAKFTFLLVMDFPSKEKLTEMFNSDSYQALIPNRNKGFVDINILYGDNLE